MGFNEKGEFEGRIKIVFVGWEVGVKPDITFEGQEEGNLVGIKVGDIIGGFQVFWLVGLLVGLADGLIVRFSVGFITIIVGLLVDWTKGVLEGVRVRANEG